MSNETTGKEISFSTLLEQVKAAGNNPMDVLQTSMDAIELITNGTTQLVDPSTPMATLWQVSAVNHTASLDMNVEADRTRYASLAQTEEDLYHGMSYRDYYTRFSVPGSTPIMFNVNLDQFINLAAGVAGQRYTMATIPRDTRVTVGTLKFTLQYPIRIKYFFDINQLEVTYDGEIESPIQGIVTNVIDAAIVSNPQDNVRWIRFTVPMIQTSVEKHVSNFQAGSLFVKNFDIQDSFYLARVFYRRNQAEGWVEMETTFSPKVYDRQKPTMRLKLVGNTLQAVLPSIYQTEGRVSGECRVDIYSTLGDITASMADYQSDEYTVRQDPLDADRDSDGFTAAMRNIGLRAWGAGMLTGGRGALTFEELRERVIFDSMGAQQIPVSPPQLVARSGNRGFGVVTHVDSLTDRLMLATRRLPPPSDPRLVTSVNVGIRTFVTDDPVMIDHPWVTVRQKRATFFSKNLYEDVNGIIRLMSQAEVVEISNMGENAKLSTVNGRKFLYSPYYTVVDTSGLELEVRSYHLDDPEASDLMSIRQNQTLQMPVNTASYLIAKTATGYKLRIWTKSGSFYKDAPDGEIFAQIGIHPTGGSVQAYWNGTLVGRDDDNERIFDFDIGSNFDVNAANSLCLTGGRITTITTEIETLLGGRINIYHLTTSLTPLYDPDDTDGMIGKLILPLGIAAISHDTLKITFGQHLKNLWSRGRSLPGKDTYKTYATDVVARYEKDIYRDPDPVTGSVIKVDGDQIDYGIIHHAGDEVLDDDGNPDILYPKGSVVRDLDGNPILDTRTIGAKEFDILMVDGRTYFVNDPAYQDYNREFSLLIKDWVTNDLIELQKDSMEKTKILFYPKSTMSYANVVVGDRRETTLDSEQSLEVTLFTTDEYYDDAAQRLIGESRAIAYLDSWISGDIVAVDVAQKGLKALYGDSVASIRVTGLGGSKNYQLVRMLKEQDRLCIKRELSVQRDGLFIISEAVKFNYNRYSPVEE